MASGAVKSLWFLMSKWIGKCNGLGSHIEGLSSDPAVKHLYAGLCPALLQGSKTKWRPECPFHPLDLEFS